MASIAGISLALERGRRLVKGPHILSKDYRIKDTHGMSTPLTRVPHLKRITSGSAISTSAVTGCRVVASMVMAHRGFQKERLAVGSFSQGKLTARTCADKLPEFYSSTKTDAYIIEILYIDYD